MLGLGLSRFVPAAFRPAVIETSSRVLRTADEFLGRQDRQRRRKPEVRPYSGERVAILGFIQAPTGLGRGARLMEHAFTARGIKCAAFDAAAFIERDPAARQAALAAIEALDPTDLVIHVNPPSMRDVIRRLPMSLTARTCVVGYWAWELNRAPRTWDIDAQLCDAIWTPSQFVTDALAATLPEFRGPIVARPHPTDAAGFPLTTQEQRRAARAKLGIADGAFVAGSAFSVASNFARKNPLAAIDAFQRAFPGHEGAALLLRCADISDYPAGREAIAAAQRDDPRIRLLSREDAPLEIFYQALDAYLSLHRGEGYGLQLVEALQTGAHVVATEFSLTSEIISHAAFHGVDSTQVAVNDPQRVYNVVPNATWAEPDVDHAARLLAALAANRINRERS